MVRYSKLSFRTLVRRYGCDLAYTPMIVSDSFVKSVKARDMEFTTNPADRPLIVQFAASNPKDFADAAEIIAPFSDGVDLNCGCPQRWAMQEGYGAKLIRTPGLIKDIVRQTVARVPGFPVSIKIRIHDDLRCNGCQRNFEQSSNVCRVSLNSSAMCHRLDRRVFSELKSLPAVLEYLRVNYNI
ncbi:tRNA-dihydrouridine(20a/20b) synthase [NAD(P)+]-like [Stylophora pistillata]|uniref:tRNA-dihydrouridine(20a/20b) synthase [NAD(P)+]-like n=1 Tax=Stylophora pistillata TaxID=50429 RepID=A0A2B4SN43_STYPI|nr:tRNA-dihydrouridine(20a/20b) synthase [NAD(P)+]-like [Stylophora pistillata]